jgi:serine/threonine-protein kinase RsbW
MASPSRLTVRVEGTRAGLSRAIDAFDGFCLAQTLEPSAVWPFQVALDEILSNIVDHGYRGRTDGVIDLTFTVADGELGVTVEDDATPLDPLALPPPNTTAPLEQRQPGGLGVHFVKGLMDRLEYARRDDRNCLVLARRLAR